MKVVLMLLLFIAIASCNNKTETTSATTETANGQTTSTFKVSGNCDMCKETIESSLKVDGISKADWNVETKIITVSYNKSKITLDQIQKKIASVGYENEKYKADVKAYRALPECCQY